MFEKVFAETDSVNLFRDEKWIRIENVGLLISAIVSLLLIISALLAFIYLILGGIQWITSGGDKSAMEAARNKITHAIIGLVIVGSAWAVMLLVQNFLGIHILDANWSVPTPYKGSN